MLLLSLNFPPHSEPGPAHFSLSSKSYKFIQQSHFYKNKTKIASISRDSFIIELSKLTVEDLDTPLRDRRRRGEAEVGVVVSSQGTSPLLSGPTGLEFATIKRILGYGQVALSLEPGRCNKRWGDRKSM
ncbi:hypothetical protein PoB_000152800 [Plakobranchus ocellatus]|uniref:Uncharacterized protein n=1 Tax=Plakobranchus ocellatus TaxID=259542 RepID=A0AAV3XYC7_9GAST|nr:hypothetical protein PoB_000152800 [Plakobranchus ocellatus]